MGYRDSSKTAIEINEMVINIKSRFARENKISATDLMQYLSNINEWIQETENK